MSVDSSLNTVLPRIKLQKRWEKSWDYIVSSLTRKWEKLDDWNTDGQNISNKIYIFKFYIKLNNLASSAFDLFTLSFNYFFHLYFLSTANYSFYIRIYIKAIKLKFKFHRLKLSHLFKISLKKKKCFSLKSWCMFHCHIIRWKKTPSWQN